jgi:hypothetical protein
MAYDERLAARVRALLANRSDVSERRMFGGWHPRVILGRARS